MHAIPPACVFAPRCASAFDACRKRRPADHAVGGRQVARCHLLDPALARSTIATPPAAPAEAESLPGGPGPPPRAAAEKLLEIEDLRVRFRTMGALGAVLGRIRDPHVDAVLGASLRVRAGETLGLVGESGSGKTTLGRAILGLVAVHSGSIRFDGTELTRLSGSALKPFRRQIAMMFQDPAGSLSPRRTVRALLTEPFQIHGLGGKSLAAQAERLCDVVSLPRSLLSRYPHELSGGQARRVGVARALALSPRLVIADEPTAGLDVSVQGEILNLMAELQRDRGLGYLIITHNLPVVRHVSDRIAIMYLGRIVEEGDCADVFGAPAHPYTEALVRGIPVPDPERRRELVSIEGEVPSLANRPRGCEFHPRCKYAQARCRTEAPAVSVLVPGHTVRCHYPLSE
jgi:oligopeptide/dipeptide ABC transporter ATP-binding protein